MNEGVADDGFRLRDLLRIAQSRKGLAGVAPLLPIADLRIGGEYLLPRRREGHGCVEGEGYERYPHVLRVSLSHNHHRHQQQGHSRYQLIGDAEEREQGLDSASRVRHAHEQQRAPGRDDGGRGAPRSRPPRRVFELRKHVSEGVRDLESGDSGDGVDGGKDEQSLEHDGEVVPEAHHSRSPAELVENMGHADRKRGRPAGSGDD